MKEIGIINFDIEEKIVGFVKNNLNDLKILFIIFAFNIIIYGQKIFFYSLASDDYTRFYSHSTDMFLTRMSGRWAQDLLNNYVFIDKLHVLPYLHGIIGIFAFTLIGFLTARYLKKSNIFETIIITLLISATPMFANNLFFNTNITAWLTLLLGIIGFLLFYKSNFFIKFLGFFFLVVGISTYQTIIQVIMAMVIFKSILDLLEIENTREINRIFLNFLKAISLVLFAYGVSVLINELIMHFGNLEAANRLKIASNVSGISIYFNRLMHMYYSNININYFSIQLKLLYVVMAGLSIFGVLVAVMYQPIKKGTKIIKLILFVLLFLSIPIVVNLPLITGNAIPTRAHYTVGWILAGFFTIQMYSLRGILKTFSIFISISIIIVSTYYINVFFNAGSRQTNSDIARANQIVNRIRTHKNYITEPLKYKIVGKKSFPVIGWNANQHALNREWSKYNIFKNFTDFKFDKMSHEEYDEIIGYLINRGEKVDSYPAKNSIIIYKNKAVLFLNTDEINNKI